jgi:cellulose biosynthesis protein BcsQ
MTGGGESGAPARWLVCSGAGEFLAIAGALVAAGRASGIEWEPDPVRARTRLSVAGELRTVVGGSDEPGSSPSEAACALADVGAGPVYLCCAETLGGQNDLRARGVCAVVAPRDLLGFLSGGSAAGCDGAPGGADGLTGPDEPGGPDEPAGSVAPGGPQTASGSPLRPAGQLPRSGIDAIALEEVPVKQPQPAGGAVEVLRAHGVEPEPVVYCPVVTLPQLECTVAGADDPVPTLCFASARGGVGKSALAVLCALSLAREGLSVALVDLDYQFGTCLGYLGAEETDGLFDVGSAPGEVRVDARTLARCRTTPEARLAAFEFCKAPEQAEVLAPLTGRLVRAARAGADVAIVDLPTGMSEVCAQAVDLADRCLMVCDQRAFSVESLKALQSLCDRMGVARTKLVTLLNRCDPRHRDENFAARVQFAAQTPQILRVFDGGSEVAQMLSIGSAGELVSMRNRFALSAGDMARGLCAEIGCLRAADAGPRSGRGRRQAQQGSDAGRGKLARRTRAEEEACPC